MVHVDLQRERLQTIALASSILALGVGMGVLWSGMQLTGALASFAPYEPDWYAPLRTQYETAAFVALGVFTAGSLATVGLEVWDGGGDE